MSDGIASIACSHAQRLRLFSPLTVTLRGEGSAVILLFRRLFFGLKDQ
ncbi:hypothetical protein QFZ88_005462 [Mesorhizobium sp. YL-MeA3-2017]|jgi:hypothetical protein|nr:hypothetical protein [Mesorhizobium sp. YL-MeA3-2017]